jgi:molybdopterin-containing oxidoreductase family iron-sulfur binding subunit
MKTTLPQCPEPATGPQYWRSLDEVAETPEFRQWVEREFPAGASEFKDPVSRRYFVKIMSASFMLAGFGLTGCRRPEEHILPFGKAPEGYPHGVPQLFATAMPVRGSAIPLVARWNDGRPTKLEGNAEHPINQLGEGEGHKHGGTDTFAQASILNLYDPDRAQRFTKGGHSATREAALDALADLAKKFAANSGEGLSFLLERSSSPSRERLQKLIAQKFPKARWFIYEPVDFDIHRQAATLAFGKPVKPFYRLEKAKRILSLDCDFIGAEEDAYRLIRGFAQGRKLDAPAHADQMSRLYAVESLFTLTGANADHRLRLPSSQVLPLACLLLAEYLAQSRAQERDSRAGDFRQALLQLGQGAKVDRKWITECVKDLLAHPGGVLALAGHRQPLAVHLVAQAFNFFLGRDSTVVYHDAPDRSAGSINDLARALNAGEVDSLVILGGNPAYNTPADLDFVQAIGKAKSAVVRLGCYEDETFAALGANGWHLPQAHYLESWGDARTGDGMVVPVQPLIAPLFGGLTELEVLARIGGLTPTSPHDVARDTFKELSPGGVFEEKWKKFLHDGFLADSAAKPATVGYSWESAAPVILEAKPLPAPTADQLEVVFHYDYKVDDGRYNNNGWLQELPDPVTKMTWENVILLSQQTANELGVNVVDRENNRLFVPVVKLTLGNREIEGPAWIQPGMADGVVGLALGYGRERTGRIGRGSGYNAYRLRTSEAQHFAAGAKLTLAGREHLLATTQNHWAMEGRPIIREGNLEHYKKDARFAAKLNMHEPPGPRDAQGRPQPMYPNPLDAVKDKSPHAWGMAIDLNACVGCSACVLACQSENNIPIVGKEQVWRNREMHWLRLDRYYAGPVADPQMVHQPMLCLHCEAAPCESVCPVNATVHDEEGLNLMVYNRCVGTRYCSNNCPYKVRRFNYFDYNRRSLAQLKGPFYPTPLLNKAEGEWGLKRWWKNVDTGTRPEDEWELAKLARNPDVSVRMRGVMEKCTYCVQRLEQAKIAQKVKAGASGDIEVPDGTIQTACQQACPADAIVFGNLKDPNSRVSKAKKNERDYTVLEFLATKPRTTYLARVRNPNPAMPDYYDMPSTLREYSQRNPDPFAQHGGGHSAGHSEPGKKEGH